MLNDLAVTATTLLDLGLARNILVIDLDVHQGDGTAFIFQAGKQIKISSISIKDLEKFLKS